ncbi:MAG: hypothetical protein JSR17_13660 [Proteobacteria bacterium]|nr:hypothetical protein [Pseudomonadota bacterium]
MEKGPVVDPLVELQTNPKAKLPKPQDNPELFLKVFFGEEAMSLVKDSSDKPNSWKQIAAKLLSTVDEMKNKFENNIAAELSKIVEKAAQDDPTFLQQLKYEKDPQKQIELIKQRCLADAKLNEAFQRQMQLYERYINNYANIALAAHTLGYTLNNHPTPEKRARELVNFETEVLSKKTSIKGTQEGNTLHELEELKSGRTLDRIVSSSTSLKEQVEITKQKAEQAPIKHDYLPLDKLGKTEPSLSITRYPQVTPGEMAEHVRQVQRVRSQSVAPQTRGSSETEKRVSLDTRPRVVSFSGGHLPPVKPTSEHQLTPRARDDDTSKFKKK